MASIARKAEGRGDFCSPNIKNTILVPWLNDMFNIKHLKYGLLSAKIEIKKIGNEKLLVF